MLYLIIIVIVIAFYLALIGFTYFSTRDIFKTSIVSFIYIFVCVSVFSAIILLDIKDMKDTFPRSTNTLFVKEDQDFLLGLKIDDMENFMKERSRIPTLFDEKTLYSLNQLYQNKDFENLVGGSFKSLVFDVRAFSDLLDDNLNLFNLGGMVSGEPRPVSGQFALSLLSSDTPLLDYLDKTYDNKQVISLLTSGAPLPKEVSQLNNTNFFRMVIFSSLFSLSLEDSGPLFIIEQLKEGNIVVYPETVTFKFIKLIPMSAFEWAYERSQKNKK